MRIAINGLGRIGKNFLRAVMSDVQARKVLDIVAINIGPEPISSVAHSVKYDTLMGTYQGMVHMDGQTLVMDGKKIPVLAHLNPSDCKWRDLSIDWVVDCSGKFTKAQKAQEHRAAGASSVLISAPAQGEDVSIIPGVNERTFDLQRHHIVSLGSCTTNAFIPILHMIHKAFTIEKAFMTTVHAYTNSQALLDLNVSDKDLRRGRAAALNMVPTSTGAADMIKKIMPDIAPHIHAQSIRVPVGKVSLIDLTFIAKKSLSCESIRDACVQASQGYLKGILDITSEELVSSDFAGTSPSVIIDAPLIAADGTMGKLCGWYDNEWAYSERLKDFLIYVNGH